MHKWTSRPWFWPLLALVLLTIFTQGKILVVLAPFAKFLVPLGVGYFVYRYVRAKVFQNLASAMEQTAAQFADAQQRARENHFGSKNANSDVIEICPKCGNPRTPRCPNCQ